MRSKALSKLDAGVVLALLQARYYDGSKGEFLSEDPVFLGDPRQQNLTDPQSLNSYSYANDNPITQKDPTGRGTPLAIPVAVVAAILVTLLLNSFEPRFTTCERSRNFGHSQPNRKYRPNVVECASSVHTAINRHANLTG